MDQPEFVPLRNQPRIVLQQFVRDADQFVLRQADVDPHVTQRPVQPLDVVLQPERPVPERSRHLRDSRPEHNPGIVDGEVRLRGGRHPAVEIDERFCHVF
jgi:hypothetical protein